MGDGYAPQVSARLRIGFAAASVLISAPFLGGGAGPVAAGVALVAVQAAGLYWLAARPVAGGVAALAAGAGLQWLVPALGPGIGFVVLCSVAWLRPARKTLWVLAAAVSLTAGPAAVRGHWDLAALWAAAAVIAWSWGALARARGARRAAERREAVLQERAPIVRELHDVLSHTVTVMVVQAAAADDVFDTHPEKAREALRRTEQTGRQALAELRWFLTEGEKGPQPTLGDLDRLAATMGDAGLAVTVRRDGDEDVPAAVQRHAYRIVQEALTNTLRHARATRADVSVEVGAAQVRVRVVDDGRGGPVNEGGHGLMGMRERAGLFGGVLSAGPRAGGGFEVDARLPLERA